jgi:CRP-like cAMP-binding protein/SAM-dependent methyltransferase
MSFLDHFDPEHRTLLLDASTELQLERGAYLMRRGEPGGDVFYLEDGMIEIIDARSTPEAILAVLTPGAVVGEGSFLDASPRSADARAQSPVRARVWTKEDLQGLLRRQPPLAARFFETIARTTTARLRNQNQSTLASMAAREGTGRAGIERVRAEALGFANETKEALLEAETQLRLDPADRAGRAALARAMNRLETWVDQHFAAHPEPELASESARLLGRELHPYLIRSALAERSIRRTQGVAGVVEVLAHVLVDTASGDGQFGELLDRWLLDRPTFQALRSVRTTLAAQAAEALPLHRNRRITVLNAGTGSLVARLLPLIADAPTVLSIVDQSRDALAVIDAGLTDVPANVQIETVQANLVDVALGRTRKQIPPQDVIVAHGLLEYLPDRLALGLLTQIRLRTVREGAVLVTALAPSPDRALLDRVLGWPTVRRRADRLGRLVDRAGFEPVLVPDVREPLLMVAARPR